jgi:hypothetical protein
LRGGIAGAIGLARDAVVRFVRGVVRLVGIVGTSLGRRVPRGQADE